MTTCSAWATIGALLNRLWLIKGANLIDQAQCWVTPTTEPIPADCVSIIHIMTLCWCVFLARGTERIYSLVERGSLRGPRPAESVPQSNKRARECEDVSWAAHTHISTVARVQWRAFTSQLIEMSVWCSKTCDLMYCPISRINSCDFTQDF